MASTRSLNGRSPLALVSLIVGATFLLVGVLGFIPGVTENTDAMEFSGHESGAELLGIFQVSILHNIVHILFGVLGIAAARAASTARNFLVVGGAVYLGLWLYGMVIDKISDANFVPVNEADDWLHLGLGAGMPVLGLALGRSTRTAGTGTTARA